MPRGAPASLHDSGSDAVFDLQPRGAAAERARVFGLAEVNHILSGVLAPEIIPLTGLAPAPRNGPRAGFPRREAVRFPTAVPLPDKAFSALLVKGA